jgi:hypothetical protein
MMVKISNELENEYLEGEAQWKENYVKKDCIDEE